MLYYLNVCSNKKIGRNELREKIKNKEYERLDEKSKRKINKK